MASIGGSLKVGKKDIKYIVGGVIALAIVGAVVASRTSPTALARGLFDGQIVPSQAYRVSYIGDAPMDFVLSS